MKNRSREILIGIFILVAYLVIVSGVTDNRVIVFLCEVVSGLAVIGIAVLIKPILTKSNENFVSLYFNLKLLEGLTMAATGFIYLLFMDSSIEIRELVFEIHSYIFIFCGFLFYLILFKSELIFRPVSIWGLISIILLFVGNILQSLNIIIPSLLIAILFLPIMLNEFFLSILLFTKGFRK